MGICFERMWGEPGASRTKRHMLNLVQPSPCHLSLTSDVCLPPQGTNLPKATAAGTQHPAHTSWGGFGTHGAPKTHQEEGTGGGRGAGCF